MNDTEALRDPLNALFRALERKGQDRGLLRSVTFHPPGARPSNPENYPNHINLEFGRTDEGYEVRLVLNPNEVRILEFPKSTLESDTLAMIGVGSPDQFVVMKDEHGSAEDAADRILDRAEEILSTEG